MIPEYGIEGIMTDSSSNNSLSEHDLALECADSKKNHHNNHPWVSDQSSISNASTRSATLAEKPNEPGISRNHIPITPSHISSTLLVDSKPDNSTSKPGSLHSRDSGGLDIRAKLFAAFLKRPAKGNPARRLDTDTSGSIVSKKQPKKDSDKLNGSKEPSPPIVLSGNVTMCDSGVKKDDSSKPKKNKRPNEKSGKLVEQCHIPSFSMIQKDVEQSLSSKLSRSFVESTSNKPVSVTNRLSRSAVCSNTITLVGESNQDSEAQANGLQPLFNIDDFSSNLLDCCQTDFDLSEEYIQETKFRKNRYGDDNTTQLEYHIQDTQDDAIKIINEIEIETKQRSDSKPFEFSQWVSGLQNVEVCEPLDVSNKGAAPIEIYCDTPGYNHESEQLVSPVTSKDLEMLRKKEPRLKQSAPLKSSHNCGSLIIQDQSFMNGEHVNELHVGQDASFDVTETQLALDAINSLVSLASPACQDANNDLDIGSDTQDVIIMCCICDDVENCGEYSKASKNAFSDCDSFSDQSFYSIDVFPSPPVFGNSKNIQLFSEPPSDIFGIPATIMPSLEMGHDDHDAFSAHEPTYSQIINGYFDDLL